MRCPSEGYPQHLITHDLPDARLQYNVGITCHCAACVACWSVDPQQRCHGPDQVLTSMHETPAETVHPLPFCSNILNATAHRALCSVHTGGRYVKRLIPVAQPCPGSVPYRTRTRATLPCRYFVSKIAQPQGYQY